MQENTLLGAMAEPERRALEPYLEDVEMKRGMQLLEIERPIDYVWFPHDAVTSTIVDTPQGITIEVGLMGAEGMVGLSLLMGTDISNTSVVVQITGRGTRIRADHFVRHVTPGTEFYRHLLRYTNAFMAMIAQTAACNSLHDIHQRLARWLLMVHDRVQADDMDLTQEYLAYMLGVRRASVSIAASGLQSQGFIKYSRGKLSILDRPGLENSTCICYGIVNRILAGVNLRKRSA